MDALKKNFSVIKNKTSNIILRLIDKELSSELDEIIASTKQMLENQTLIDDLNESIFWMYKQSDNEYKCFYELIEALLTFIEAKHDQNENAFKIIEIVSSINLREILEIKSTFFLRLLHLMTPEKEERTLNIILSLSQNYVYEKIDFLILDHSTLLDRIERMVNTHFPIKDNIVSNLNEKLFRDRLDYLIQFDLDKEHLEEDETFLNDLKAVSLVLNRKKERFMHVKLIFTNESIQFFIRYFKCLIVWLKTKEILESRRLYALNNLSEILIKLIRSPYNFKDEFLKQGILQVFYELFKATELLKKLFERHINILYKLIDIFRLLAKRLYTLKQSKNNHLEYLTNDPLMIPFDLLTETRDFLEKLYKEADEDLMKEKPLFKKYLRGLVYFQEIFQPEIQLLKPEHYDIILNSIFFSFYFNRIRNDFLDECEFIYLEFRNELGEIEFEKVVQSFKSYHQRSIEGGFQNHKYRLIERIILLRELFSKNDSLATNAYITHQCFLKSIIFYGPCIERLLCLHLLAKFCQAEEIRDELFGDKNLIEFIKSLYSDLNENRLNIEDKFKTRYKNVLKDFLEFEIKI
jgi:hypothetical protein